MQCCTRELTTLPPGDWYCDECTADAAPATLNRKTTKGKRAALPFVLQSKGSQDNEVVLKTKSQPLKPSALKAKVHPAAVSVD